MVPQLAPAEAAQWLSTRADVVLVDVREPWELAHAAIPGALSFPMSEIGRRQGELPQDRTLLVLCHHGVRSNVVAAHLARVGHAQVVNVRGGIEAWATEVDSTLGRY